MIGMSDGEVVLNPLYRFRETGESGGRVIGSLEPCGNPLQSADKLHMAGITAWRAEDDGGDVMKRSEGSVLTPEEGQGERVIKRRNGAGKREQALQLEPTLFRITASIISR